MKNIKLSILLLAALPVFNSCNNDEINNASSEYINSVRVTVEDFVPENSTTRTAYTVDGTGFHFAWADGDALGIYPIGGDQVKFPISSGDGSASATFDGGSWKLRSTYQYAAYYPFSTANYTIDQTALPVSYTGQTQDGNASTAHLGAYDYLACAATTPDANGGVDLTMKHLGAFVRLQLTRPKADTYSSVVLKSDNAKFVTAGTFDLTAATPAIISTATSDTYTINLTNVSTAAKNEVVTVYAMVAPADLSSSNVTVTVHGAGSTTYVQTVTGKNFEARSAYNIAVESFPTGTNASGEDVNWAEETATTGTENGHVWVDLGLSVKWATCNVGATNSNDYGGYYAWGETSTKSNYSWSNYFDTDDGSTFRKYYLKGKTTLESSDDIAATNWGGSWRIPTFAEQSELRKNCTWTWTTQNGVNGYSVSAANGNSIFIPAAGYYDSSSNFAGSEGYYWSSSLGSSLSTSAYDLGFRSDGSVSYYQDGRCVGRSVRPVCE